MVRNHGIANRLGSKLMSRRWVVRTGSWKATICQNFAKYSLMTALLSFRKNLWRKRGTNAERQAKARAITNVEYLSIFWDLFCITFKVGIKFFYHVKYLPSGIL